MFLARLKYWRTMRGFSVRELAEKSGVDASTVSLLENLKRTPHGKTVRDLAATLEVKIDDLYETVGADLVKGKPGDQSGQNTYKTQTPIAGEVVATKVEPIKRSILTKGKKKPPENFWVIDAQSDAFGPFIREEAERLKVKLEKGRVYEGTTKFEVWEKHRQFMIAVTRGHEMW